jgi:histidinol dehydrogenase
MIPIIQSSDLARLDRIFRPASAADRQLSRRVAGIVQAVRRRGDRALLSYAKRFDRLDGPLELPAREVRREASHLPADARRALERAAASIAAVARRQVPSSWRVETATGVSIEQRVQPFARVGCYVPGGRFPLPSSLLMTAVPARIAGVTDIVAACPRPDPAVCAAAIEAGVSRLFRMGGAHAIAALAYGTGTIPRVEKVVGPGNRYVTAAKALVAADCGIDLLAGPTEIFIVARATPPEIVAADLVAQAEHDPDARAVLVTWSARYASDVARAADRQAGGTPAETALRRRGGIVVARSRREAVTLVNRAAPEHVYCEVEATANAIRSAGTVFVGRWSAPATGDYATGSNHVLPTGGAARLRGGLSAADFVRVFTVQRLSERGLRRIAPTAMTLARVEGLEGHARSVAVRLEGGE